MLRYARHDNSGTKLCWGRSPTEPRCGGVRRPAPNPEQGNNSFSNTLAEWSRTAFRGRLPFILHTVDGLERPSYVKAPHSAKVLLRLQSPSATIPTKMAVVRWNL